MFDRLLAASMAILLASVAVYCAARIIEAIWHILVIIAGVFGLVWIVIVLIRAWLARRY